MINLSGVSGEMAKIFWEVATSTRDFYVRGQELDRAEIRVAAVAKQRARQAEEREREGLPKVR